MSKHTRRPSPARRSAIVTLGLAAGLSFTACNSSSNNNQNQPDAGTQPSDGGSAVLGNGSVSSALAIAPTGEMFWSPQDSIPSPDGTQVYFIARAPEGARNADSAGVFRVAASGGAVTKLHSGAPLAAPVNLTVSSDGSTLFVVDTSADDGMEHQGRIFSLSTAGGAPSAVTGADGTQPAGIDLVKDGGSDVLYFTGRDPSDGTPAIFRMSATGANRATVLKGGLLRQPSALAVNKSGVVFVTDGSATRSPNAGAILKIENGVASMFAGGLRLGFPSGIALVQDESAILVSALDPMSGGAIVYRYDAASKQKATFNTGIAQNTESGGLHRARNADIYAWANADGCRRCSAGQGAVYLVR